MALKTKTAVTKEAVLSTLRIHNAGVKKCSDALGLTPHQFMFHIRFYDLLEEMELIVDTKRRMILDDADEYVAKALDPKTNIPMDRTKVEFCRTAYYNFVQKEKADVKDAVNLDKLAQQLDEIK